MMTNTKPATDIFVVSWMVPSEAKEDQFIRTKVFSDKKEALEMAHHIRDLAPKALISVSDHNGDVVEQ